MCAVIRPPGTIGENELSVLPVVMALLLSLSFCAWSRVGNENISMVGVVTDTGDNTATGAPDILIGADNASGDTDTGDRDTAWGEATG